MENLFTITDLMLVHRRCDKNIQPKTFCILKILFFYSVIIFVSLDLQTPDLDLEVFQNLLNDPCHKKHCLKMLIKKCWFLNQGKLPWFFTIIVKIFEEIKFLFALLWHKLIDSTITSNDEEIHFSLLLIWHQCLFGNEFSDNY